MPIPRPPPSCTPFNCGDARGVSRIPRPATPTTPLLPVKHIESTVLASTVIKKDRSVSLKDTKVVRSQQCFLPRTRPEAKNLAYSIPDTQKLQKLPRIKPPSKDYQDTTTIGHMSSSNCLTNKGSTTSTSASTLIIKETSPSLKDAKAESLSSIPANADSTSRYSFHPNGLKPDEVLDKHSEEHFRVQVIPELKVKLALLKEMNLQLTTELDNEKQKCAHSVATLPILIKHMSGNQQSVFQRSETSCRIPRLAIPTKPKSPEKSVKSRIKVHKPSAEESSTALPTPLPHGIRKPLRSETFTKEVHFPRRRFSLSELKPLKEEDKERPSTSESFASLQEPREKASPSKEMLKALNVLNDALLSKIMSLQITSAMRVILDEWFRVAGATTANPFDVKDYLDCLESFSPQLFRYIVNLCKKNGSSVIHYAASHGNFGVISILLDSKVCDSTKANNAGYTSVMLVSLAEVFTDTHRQVVRRLFSLGDVNLRVCQHGPTALILASSRGRLETVKLLIEAGAEVNIHDNDGSTSLMCAAEHGYGDIVKYLLEEAKCDPNIMDKDGRTAFNVAMEAGHKDIGVMLYAHMHFLKEHQSSANGSLLAKLSRSNTPSSRNSESPVSSSHTSLVMANKQHE